MRHPLYQFQFCPVCGAKAFVEHNEKAKNVWRAVLFIISTRRRLSLVS